MLNIYCPGKTLILAIQSSGQPLCRALKLLYKMIRICIKKKLNKGASLNLETQGGRSWGVCVCVCVLLTDQSHSLEMPSPVWVGEVLCQVLVVQAVVAQSSQRTVAVSHKGR